MGSARPHPRPSPKGEGRTLAGLETPPLLFDISFPISYDKFYWSANARGDKKREWEKAIMKDLVPMSIREKKLDKSKTNDYLYYIDLLPSDQLSGLRRGYPYEEVINAS